MIARFRRYLNLHALGISCTILILAFMAILYLQAMALAQLQIEVQAQQVTGRQTKALLDRSAKNAAYRTAQIETLSHHIDCIVQFFTLQDRTPKAISNIQTCTIQDANGTVTPLATSL